MDNSKPLEVCEFADLEEAIGGSIERFAINRPDASLIQSESAMYLELPTNRRATVILWMHATSHRGRSATAGDVVLLGRQTEEMRFEDVPEWYVKILLEAEHFKVHKQRLDDMLWREHSHIFDDWIQAYATILLEAQKDALTHNVRVVPA
ncbi:hypothetical protein AB0280_17760 [Pseudarthrobacter sp902506025]|uniref:DUF3846 domain-containing protein n=1 Tax=Pseudarthrobacter sp. 902506025 TaxID=3155291 RepID=UPI00344DE5EC